MFLGYLFAAVTAIVLLEPVVNGSESVNVNHLLTFTAFIATVAAAHRARTLPYMLIAVCGLTYTIISAGSRNAEVMASRVAAAKQPELQLRIIQDGLSSQKALLNDALLAAARECSSGKGRKCQGRMTMVEHYQAQVKDFETQLKNAPAPHPSGYAQTAKLFVHVFGGNQTNVETTLTLVMPYIIVVLCEFSAIVFLSERQTKHLVSSPVRAVPEPCSASTQKMKLEVSSMELLRKNNPLDWVRDFRSSQGRDPTIKEFQEVFPLPRTTAWRKIKAA